MSILQFRNVSFGYDPNTPILRNINLDLQLGKTYALVGATGGGKTTTAYLMSGLYEPSIGEIILNGKNLKEYSKSQISLIIGYIMQDPIIFGGDVASNIVYGNTELSQLDSKSLIEYIEQEGYGELIRFFDEGLETKVGNNTNLSLGQKQIIAFLRAVLRRPKLLILDEATSNIDTVTETILNSIIDSLPSSTTKVIIAHRLNTIEFADQIFFVGGGRIDPVSNFVEVQKKFQK